MTIWRPDLSRHPGPSYQALADAIATAVRDGELARGEKLPPQRDLAAELGLAVATVGRAYTIAEQRRLVSGQVGRGTFVLDPTDDALSALQADNGVIDLTRNLPSAVGQIAALGHAMEECSRSTSLHELSDYMPELGHRRYRDAGLRWLRAVGLKVSPERIMVTGGGQHALAIASLSLAQPGDAVLVENLTFPGVLNAVQLAGAKPIGLPMDDEGVLPDALERSARETRARLVILTPTIHSPTTATMSLKRRRAIASIIQALDMVLVEDDVYGYIPQRRPLPIAMLAPEHTIYVTSISKCVMSGLGVGWAVAPPALRDRLGGALHALSQALPAIGPAIATQWIQDGTAQRLLAKQRVEIAARHAIAAKALQGLSWHGRPDALHVFIELPPLCRSEDLVAQASRHGIIACPARMFAVVPENAPNAIRVTLGTTRDRDALKRALGILVELIVSGESGAINRRIV